MKLMTLYDWTMVTDLANGKHITIVRLSDDKRLKFYIANPQVDADRVALHLDSLTDDHCEQWFDESLTVEERKAKQKARKEQARKEREELEARVAEQKAHAAKIKALEKAEEKARRAAKRA